MKNRYFKNVSTLKLDVFKCNGCGRCVEVCPHDVFEINNSKTKIINIDGCMECGACAKNCQLDAIEVKTGVGCAYAIIMGWMTGSEPNCDCSDGNDSGCC